MSNKVLVWQRLVKKDEISLPSRVDYSPRYWTDIRRKLCFGIMILLMLASVVVSRSRLVKL